MQIFLTLHSQILTKIGTKYLITCFNARSTRNVSEMIGGSLMSLTSWFIPGQSSWYAFTHLLLHGATYSYVTPTYLRRLYKYAYNKHMDILYGIEWNKGPYSIWFFFYSPMFAPAFPWYLTSGEFTCNEWMQRSKIVHFNMVASIGLEKSHEPDIILRA